MMDKFKPGDIVVVREHEPYSLKKCGLASYEQEIKSCFWEIEEPSETVITPRKYYGYRRYYIKHGIDECWVLEKDLRLVKKG